MTSFGQRIRPEVDLEVQAAVRADAAQHAAQAFRHLERAHVLGQASTVQHVRVHVLMLLWAVRQRAPRELAGQLLRIAGAATKTALGWVPSGNTGGANVSPFKSLPIPTDLARILARAKRR
ncbi:MAG: DUF3703 domain-containing protein [Roseateles sp.]